MSIDLQFPNRPNQEQTTASYDDNKLAPSSGSWWRMWGQSLLLTPILPPVWGQCLLLTPLLPPVTLNRRMYVEWVEDTFLWYDFLWVVNTGTYTISFWVVLYMWCVWSEPSTFLYIHRWHSLLFHVSFSRLNVTWLNHYNSGNVTCNTCTLHVTCWYF